MASASPPSRWYTKNPTMEWIGQSFVETLNEQLVSSWLSPVTEEQRNAIYERLGLPYDGDFSRATLIKVGEELDANYAVVGSYHYEQSEFSVAAELINVDASRLEATFGEKGPLDTLKKIQSRIAWRVLTHFDSIFPYNQEEFYKQFGEVPLSAFENYVRGRRAVDSKSQLQYFLKAERIDPAYSNAIFQIGRLYFQQKDYATSQLWLRRITKEERHFHEAAFYLGLDYYFMKNFDKAAAAFSSILTELPLNEVYNNLAAALSRIAGSTQVVRNYQKAIEGDPGEPDFYFNLGYYFWKSGDQGPAARYLRESLQLNPQDAEAAYLLANSLETLKQADESSHFLRLASRLNPKAVNWTAASLPPLERVKLNYDALAFRELRATLDFLQEQKLKNRPPAEQISEHLRQGVEYFDELRNQDAVREFERALALDPNLSEAHGYLGRIREREGELEDAIKEWKISLRAADSAIAHAALAHLYYNLNRPKDAEQEVAAALALEPENRDALELRALLQQKSSTGKR
ncbi:MAG: tetratricopeptide repeat protein [Acidobacteriia bacterium]|nr:tetratricopeptide repeat protein [Terriglobia bacterium]